VTELGSWVHYMKKVGVRQISIKSRVSGSTSLDISSRASGTSILVNRDEIKTYHDVVFTKVKIMSFMNEVRGIFDKQRSFSNEW